MVKERVQPDFRTYGILIRACLYQDIPEQAASLLRAALGLPGALHLPDPRLATCYTVDHHVVNETLSSLADRGCAKSLAAPLLADIKNCKVRVNIDQGMQRRIVSGVADGPSSTTWTSTKGKGR